MSRKNWLLPALLPLLYVPLLFGRALWDSGLAILFRDAGSLTLPAKHLTIESIRRFHELPGWNPYVLGGVPFLADPSFTALYPLNAIFLLFPDAKFPFAHTWFLAAHIPLAFAGFYCFFRRFGAPAFFALAGAISIAGGGYAVSSLYMAGALGGLVAASWLFFFWVRFLEERKARDLFLSSFFLALPVFAGDPQWAYMLGLFFAPALALTYLPPRAAGKWLAALGLLTALVAAPQVLPTADLLLQSPRDLGGGLPQDAETWSLHPVRLLEWLLPLPFGSSFYMESGIRRYSNGIDFLPFIFSVYAGFFFLPAFLAGATRGAWRERSFRVWVGIAAFFVVVSLGKNSPVPLNLWLGRILPIWGSFRYPERLTVFAQIALLLATAASLRRADARQFLRRFAWCALGGAALACVFALARFPDPAVTKSVLLPVALFTALGLAVLRRLGTAGREGRLLAILALAAAVDLGGEMRAVVWTVPSKVASPDWAPYLQLVKKEWGPVTIESFPRFFSEDEQWLRWDVLDRLADGHDLGLPGKLTLHQSLALLLNTGSYFGVGTPLGFSTLMHRRQRRFWDAVVMSDIPRAFALKGTNFIGRQLKNGDYALITLKDSKPLFSVPEGVDFVGTEKEALGRVAARGWDWSRRITVEDPEKLNASIEQDAALAFRVVRRTFNELVVEVRAGRAAKDTWVLWNESYDHFWSAVFRGKELPTYKGNYWANAFLLPGLGAGETGELVLTYENPLVSAGWALAGVWALLWALFSVRGRRRAK